MAAGMTLLQAVIDLHRPTDATMLAAIRKLEGDPGAAAGSNANKGSQLVYKHCVDALGNAVTAMG